MEPQTQSPSHQAAAKTGPAAGDGDEGLQGTALSRLNCASPGIPKQSEGYFAERARGPGMAAVHAGINRGNHFYSGVMISSTGSEVQAVLKSSLSPAGLHERYDDRCAASA